MRFFKLLAAALLLLTVLAACGGDNAPAGETVTPTSDPASSTQTSGADGSADSEVVMAPDFTIELLNGEEFTLSDHRGEVVLINFWATWCGPCVGEFPELERLAEDYADQGVYVLAVNCSERQEKVQDFVDEQEVTLNIGLDPEMDVQSKYPTNGIPYTVFVDVDGSVAHAVVGVHPEDHYGYLTEKLDAILAAHTEGEEET